MNRAISKDKKEEGFKKLKRLYDRINKGSAHSGSITFNVVKEIKGAITKKIDYREVS